MVTLQDRVEMRDPRGVAGVTLISQQKCEKPLKKGHFFWGKSSSKIFQRHDLLEGFPSRNLVGGDWNHGILNDCPIFFGIFIIPTDELTPFLFIFQRCRLRPPTRSHSPQQTYRCWERIHCFDAQNLMKSP